jgi:RNA polymerase sigma factor (sigma-70 family)
VTLSQAKEEPMHQPDEGDAEIIARSLRRPDRFATIFDRHATHIRRYLARRLGGHVADDLVAETFVVAFGKRAGYDQTRPDARPWLYGIATNLLRKHHRDEAREYRLRASIAPEPDEAGHADRVAARVTAAAMHRLLAMALAELSAGDRDVLLLIAWEGLTYEEVAGHSRFPSAPSGPASTGRASRCAPH